MSNDRLWLVHAETGYGLLLAKNIDNYKWTATENLTARLHAFCSFIADQGFIAEHVGFILCTDERVMNGVPVQFAAFVDAPPVPDTGTIERRVRGEFKHLFGRFYWRRKT